MGAALSRNDSYALYEGTNIDCTLDGLAYVRGTQVADTHTAIDHARPHSRSYQLHKCIADEQAHTVFNGKIFVRKDAQQTKSEQLNQNLLLSKKAHIDTKPQLEILADDVVCSHGATVGQLEDDQLFYLLSRGVDPTSARNLLTYAFAAEVIETITVDSLRKQLEAIVLTQATTQQA
jgi:Fe-S cluster assembly protein SufD